jgi:hypothetical protein
MKYLLIVGSEGMAAPEDVAVMQCEIPAGSRRWIAGASVSSAGLRLSKDVTGSVRFGT